MTEELNLHFSPVFQREDTSSLPVPETKFNGTEGEYYGVSACRMEWVQNKSGTLAKPLLTVSVFYHLGGAGVFH